MRSKHIEKIPRGEFQSKGPPLLRQVPAFPLEVELDCWDADCPLKVQCIVQASQFSAASPSNLSQLPQTRFCFLALQGLPSPQQFPPVASFLSPPSPKPGRSLKGGLGPSFAFSGLGVSPEWQEESGTAGPCSLLLPPWTLSWD